MQFKLILAIVLIGASFIQVSSAQPTSQGLQRNLVDDLMKKAQEAIEQLTKLIEKQIQEALNIINDLKNQVNEQVAQALEAAKKQLQELIDKSKEAIEEIKKKANQLGIDISECIADSENQFQELFEKFLADEVHCVTGEVAEVMRIITEAIQLLTDVYDTVSALPQKLKDCTSNSKPIICITNVILEAAKLQKDLPMAIATKIKEVSEFISGFQARLEICASTQLANAGLGAAGIVAEITKCAIEKGVEIIL